VKLFHIWRLSQRRFKCRNKILFKRAKGDEINGKKRVSPYMHKTAKYWKDKEDIIIKDGKNELNTSEHAKRFDSFGKNLFKS